MGILIFQAVIVIIIYIASRAGMTSKIFTIIALLLFSLVMIKTSGLFFLQIITILLSASIFKNENNQKEAYRRRDFTPSSNLDWSGDSYSKPKSIEQNRNNSTLKVARRLLFYILLIIGVAYLFNSL
ncbi:hypothetical protein H7F37_03175 [Winogradskyella sp. PAMC22761]|nr:hypothetical protein H7F37_03175 [Winogradskyella sp. PAMC22761]